MDKLAQGTPTSIELSGKDFDPQKLLASRNQTWKALQLIERQIQAGMTEEDAYEMAKRTLKELGSEREWHRTYVRLGSNTTKVFGEASAPRMKLEENDIFFIDIGPVWDGYEGDAGATFTRGSNPLMEKCSRDAELVFRSVREQWIKNHLSGEALYQLAIREAKQLGWDLNLGSNGHRLSDFPHAAYFRGSLQEANFNPRQYAWVLEIQITEPNGNFGAFYEDLLL